MLLKKYDGRICLLFKQFNIINYESSMTRFLDNKNLFYYVHPNGANCNVYAFRDGKELDLIDAGISKLGSLKWLWQEMKKDGLRPDHVKRIFHTHVHFDHVQADIFFQKKAADNGIKTKIFYPAPDKARWSEKYNVIQTNIGEIKKNFHYYPPLNMEWSYFLLKSFGNSLIKYEKPYNLVEFNKKWNIENNETNKGFHKKADFDKFHLGYKEDPFNITAITTGGHTAGHTMFYMNLRKGNEEEKVIFNGDAGCINEYTSDWRKMIQALITQKALEPDHRLGGHDPIQIGRKNVIHGIDSSFRRHDQMLRPTGLQMLPGKIIDLSMAAHHRVGFAFSFAIVRMWAHMTLYCLGKTLENEGWGKIHFREDGKLLLKLYNSPEINKKYREFREVCRDKGSSPTMKMAELLSIQPVLEK